MVRVNVAVPVPPLLVALRVTLKIPTAVGVPEIRPVTVLTDNPAGNPVACKAGRDMRRGDLVIERRPNGAGGIGRAGNHWRRGQGGSPQAKEQKACSARTTKTVGQLGH